MTAHPFEIQLPLAVKTYDIDFAGIVSNIVYVRWLEDLRLEMLARHFPLHEQLADGIAPIVMQTRVDYKRAVKLSDRPLGRMWMSSLDSLRWTVTAEITVDEQVAVAAEQSGIFVELQRNRPIRLPQRLKQMYHEILEQEAGVRDPVSGISR